MSILETIVGHKKKEVESAKEVISVNELKRLTGFERKPVSLREFISREDKSGIIAEFKRKSPSKGVINDESPVEEVVGGYTKFGASAISVLTDFNFFGGSADDLIQAREITQIPILRKEFMIDEYQFFEAKALGADAVLLIAAILTTSESESFAKLAHQLGMEVILEIHSEEELDHINRHVDIVGVNNRNLKNFEVNLQNSVELAGKIPDDFLKISESGIASVEDIEYLRQHNFEGFLIGENFMKTPDPVGAFAAFIKQLKLGGLAQ